MRPKSIRLFERLFLSSQLASIVAIFSHYNIIRSAAVINGKSPTGPIAGIVLTIIIALPLWFFIVRKGSGFARWVAIAFFALGSLGVPASIPKALSIGPIYLALFLLAFGLSAGSIIMLFRPDAVRWIKSGGKSQQADPEVFS